MIFCCVCCLIIIVILVIVYFSVHNRITAVENALSDNGITRAVVKSLSNKSQSNIDTNDSQISNGGKIPVLVKFYLNGCPPCKALAPEWEKLEKELEGLPIKLISLEYNENPELMKKLGIQGFPTIRLYKNGLEDQNVFVEHTGQRHAENLIEFVKENL